MEKEPQGANWEQFKDQMKKVDEATRDAFHQPAYSLDTGYNTKIGAILKLHTSDAQTAILELERMYQQAYEEGWWVDYPIIQQAEQERKQNLQELARKERELLKYRVEKEHVKRGDELIINETSQELTDVNDFQISDSGAIYYSKYGFAGLNLYIAGQKGKIPISHLGFTGIFAIGKDDQRAYQAGNTIFESKKSVPLSLGNKPIKAVQLFYGSNNQLGIVATNEKRYSYLYNGKYLGDLESPAPADKTKKGDLVFISHYKSAIKDQDKDVVIIKDQCFEIPEGQKYVGTMPDDKPIFIPEDPSQISPDNFPFDIQVPEGYKITKISFDLNDDPVFVLSDINGSNIIIRNGKIIDQQSQTITSVSNVQFNARNEIVYSANVKGTGSEYLFFEGFNTNLAFRKIKGLKILLNGTIVVVDETRSPTTNVVYTNISKVNIRYNLN